MTENKRRRSRSTAGRGAQLDVLHSCAGAVTLSVCPQPAPAWTTFRVGLYCGVFLVLLVVVVITGKNTVTFVTLKCLIYTSWNLTVCGQKYMSLILVVMGRVCHGWCLNPDTGHVSDGFNGLDQGRHTLWATNSTRTSEAPPTVSVKTSHIVFLHDKERNVSARL